MTVQSEAEAVRQAKEYLDMGLVVNAIKRPDGCLRIGFCEQTP